MTGTVMDRASGLELPRDARALCHRTWWVFLIGGFASVAFGILAFVNPKLALFVLATFFAASVLVDGAVNAWGALQNREKDGWWLMLLLGIAGILVGGYALLNPPLSMAAFVYLVAFLALVAGILFITMGYKIRQVTEKEWLLYLAGGTSALFGLLILYQPLAGGLSVVWMVASWAVLVGVVRIWFAFRVRQLVRS